MEEQKFEGREQVLFLPNIIFEILETEMLLPAFLQKVAVTNKIYTGILPYKFPNAFSRNYQKIISFSHCSFIATHILDFRC